MIVVGGCNVDSITSTYADAYNFTVEHLRETP
jgi:hypothetical protein